MKKTIIGIVIVVVAILGVTLIPTKNDKKLDVVSTAQGTYCGPDGLTDTKPIQSHRSYCLKSNASEVSFAPNTPASMEKSLQLIL